MFLQYSFLCYMYMYDDIVHVTADRVLSRILSLGEKIRFEIDGGCVCVGGGGGPAATGWSLLGGSRGMPPPPPPPPQNKKIVILSLVRVVLRYFKTVLRSW